MDNSARLDYCPHLRCSESELESTDDELPELIYEEGSELKARSNFPASKTRLEGGGSNFSPSQTLLANPKSPIG